MYKKIGPIEVYNDVPATDSASEGIEIELVEAVCFSIKKTTTASSTSAPVTIQASINGEDWDDLSGTADTIDNATPFRLFDVAGTGAGLPFPYVRLKFGTLTNPGDTYVVEFSGKGN